MHHTHEHPLVELVRELETVIDTRAGWDAPASLWELRPLGESESLGSGVVLASYGLELLTTLDGHPYDAMRLQRASSDALGVVLVTEGWAYSAERAARKPSRPPSAYSDSREVRLAHLVLRTGEEAWLHHRRGENAEGFLLDPDAIDRFTGRVSWATRRVIGAPSRAEAPAEGPLPPVAEIRTAVLSGACLDALRSLHELAGSEVMADAVRILLDGRGPTALSAAPVGLDQETWEEAYEHFVLAQRRLLHELAATESWEEFDACEESLHLLEWWDWAMWARELLERILTPRALAESLLRLARDTALGVDDVRGLAGLLDLEPPYGGWGTFVRPGRNDPCPCGSLQRYKTCHGAARVS